MMKSLTIGTAQARGGIAIAVFLLACGSVAQAQEATLTLWHKGDCPPDDCVSRDLAEGFEASNPGIKVEIVQQPNDSYFTSLLTQSVIGRGPDVAYMWTGLYLEQFAPYMADLREYIPEEILSSVSGLEFASEDFDTRKAIWAAPVDTIWYSGYYNKKAFADAGVAEVPTTWEELRAASQALKDKGYTPIILGSTGGAQFGAYFDWSYLMAAVPLSEWGKFVSGETPYSDPRLVDQLNKWHQLYVDGFYNEDAFNRPNVVAEFAAGKAGMYLGTTSSRAAGFHEALGDDVGIIIPPYSDTEQNALVEFVGTGFSVMNYSKNLDAAGKFAAFVLSDEGQAIIAESVAPTRPGFPVSNPLINELQELSADPSTVVYPMIDNFMQPPVVDAMNRNIAQVLIGQMTPEAALAALDAVVASLPAEEKKPVSFVQE